MKKLTRKKMIISAVCALITGITAVSLIAFAIHQKNESTRFHQKSTFEPSTATFACARDSDGNLYLFDIGRERYDSYNSPAYFVSTHAETQLHDYGIEAGDFAEITCSGNAVSGCDNAYRTVTDIQACQELTPTQALSRQTAEMHYNDYRHFQIWNDFVMFPIDDAIYAYTHNSDEALIFEDSHQALDYFGAEIITPESTQPELFCPYELQPYYLKTENNTQSCSYFLKAEAYPKEKKSMPEELRNFIDQTWNGSDGMYITGDAGLTDNAMLYYPHDYSGLFSIWQGDGIPVNYAVFYVEAEEFEIMYNKFFGIDETDT